MYGASCRDADDARLHCGRATTGARFGRIAVRELVVLRIRYSGNDFAENNPDFKAARASESDLDDETGDRADAAVALRKLVNT